MAVVHTAEPVVEHYHSEGESSMGWVVGLILLAIFAFMFFYYALPLMRGATQAPQVSVPERVDVNVNRQ